MHVVELDAYYISKFEITNRAWKKFGDDRGYDDPKCWPGGRVVQRDQIPYWTQVNNDGGGIFDFLPVSREGDEFVQHIATPHGLDFAHAAALFGYGPDHFLLRSSWGMSDRGKRAKFYSLTADKLPGGRGHGEPFRLMVDIEDAGDCVELFVYEPGRKLLVASESGHGFIVAEDEVIAMTRKGKQILNVKSDDEAAVCTPVEGDSVAVIGCGGVGMA